MKMKIFLLLLSFLILPMIAHAINGELDNSHPIPILRVWGTPYEMGYAHGYLLGEAIRDEFDGYILPLTLYQDWFYEFVVDLFREYYALPERYIEEAEGIIDGALAAGADFYIPSLGRNINALDLAVTGAMPDIIGLVSCSTLIAWGDATIDDLVLAGRLALVRNLDWLALPTDPTFLARRTILIARTPIDRRQTVSVTFPGLVGCLSCMNDAGVTANHHQVHPGVLFFNRDYSKPFVPINLSIREGLELEDPNGDGGSTVSDVADIVESMPKSSQYNIVLADAFPENNAPMSLETANDGSARRYDYDDPDFPSRTLGVTNHFRKKKEQKADNRYKTILKNANDWFGKISLERLWENNNQVAMRFPFGEITAQTMIFLPDSRQLALAYSDEEYFAPDKEPIWFSWDDLFPEEEIDDDDSLENDDDHDDPDDDTVPGKAKKTDDEDYGSCCG